MLGRAGEDAERTQGGVENVGPLRVTWRESLQVFILNLGETPIATDQQETKPVRYGKLPRVGRSPSDAASRFKQEPVLLDEGIVFGKANDPLVDAKLVEPLHAGEDDASRHENARSPGPQRARPVGSAGPCRPYRLLKVLPSLLERDARAAIERVREVLACAAHPALVSMAQAKRRNDFVGS
jgi:hypothetical protein